MASATSHLHAVVLDDAQQRAHHAVRQVFAAAEAVQDVEHHGRVHLYGWQLIA